MGEFDVRVKLEVFDGRFEVREDVRVRGKEGSRRRKVEVGEGHCKGRELSY
jgi:hypothetical protein